LVYPLDTRGGSNAITIISKGKRAHSINHHIGLRPFLIAIIPPTIPAIISRITYLSLSNGILYFFMIIRLSLLYLTYAYKWHSAAACNLGEDSIPFIYSLEIGLYLSKLYKVR